MANILSLPDEIKINIFNYLDGVDKIELLKVCNDFKRVGGDRDVLKCLNFCKNYRLTLKQLKFIARKPTASKITWINLNGIHWIPSAQLRDTLSKFENLYALYVIDTQLTFRDLVKTLKYTNKVRKLALSLKSDSCGDVFDVKITLPITHLYVVYNSYAVRVFLVFLIQFKELDELWLIEPQNMRKVNIQDEFNWSVYEHMVNFPRISNKIVLNKISNKIGLKRTFIDLYLNSHTNMVKLCELTDNQLVFFVLENIKEHYSVKRVHEIEFLESLHSSSYISKLYYLFSLADVKVILYHPEKFSGYIQSLNLSHKMQDIDFKSILFSKLVCRLRKFRCDSFPFWEAQADEKVNTALFKKQRIGLSAPKINENSLFAKFSKHAQEIEDFEMIDNDSTALRDKLWQMGNLTFVQNWKVLKKLTISSVNFISGKFLTDITKNCPLLNCLKIKDDLVQDNLSVNLCEALKYATNLKDLRYERKGGIPVDQLFESLTKCLKLERLYIQCQFASKISKKPLETVITRCENLVFLFIYISELPETVCKSIKQSVMEFGIKPQQIISIRGQSYDLQTIMYEDIPSCHVQEIVYESNDFHYEYLCSFLNS